MAAGIPREAGKLIVRVRGKRSGPILGGTMLVILAAMPVVDHKLWPVSLAIVGMAVLGGGLAFAVTRLFGRKLIAVGELGLVIRERGRVVVVPWSGIQSVTRVKGGPGMAALSTAISPHYSITLVGGKGVGFVPHDLRGDIGDQILDALRMFGKQRIAS